MGFSGKRSGSDALLAEAVARLRSGLAEGGALSAAARARILARLPEGRPEPRRRLSPAFRLALAASIPLAFVGLTAVVALYRAGGRQAPAPGAILRAEKVGDRVVFTIANGGRPHLVYRSSDPARFDRGSAEQVVGGRFQDRAGGEQGIVFYRVE